MGKIFKYKNILGGSEKGLAVFQLTKQVLSYIALYALAKGVTKSAVYCNIILDWFSVMSKSSLGSRTVLIRSIVNKIIEQYNYHSFNTVEINDFWDQITRELRSKGIDEQSIKEIIYQLQQQNEKT